MRRYGRKIDWNAKAVLGLGAALLVVLTLSQIPNFYYVWLWGPNTGYRSADLNSGHYERAFPGILRGMPLIGVVFLGKDDRLIVDYDLTLDEGSVAFSAWKFPTLLHRPEYIGPRSIKRSAKRRLEFSPGEAGFYRLYMYAHRIQGDVAVDWRTTERRARARAE